MAGIYIHIPFCKQACNYCDFHFSTSLKLKNDLIEALICEIKLRAPVFKNKLITSIYFGGGTPSLLNEMELHGIFEQLFQSFSIAENVEITLEANPDDLSAQKLTMFHASPINRLSIGVQSFHDDDLLFMNRVHSANEAKSSILMSQDKGFENISIDLIYGTPTLNDSTWKLNIETSFKLNIPHISSYALTVEERTTLYHQIKSKKVAAVDEIQSAQQFELLMCEMEQYGYEHYEISNFCKPNAYSKHNSSYWKNEPYLGFGPSAHSYNDNCRLWNVKNNAKYIHAIKAGRLDFEEEVLSDKDCYNEYVMTSLRTMWGCAIHFMKEKFPQSYSTHFIKEINKYVLNGSVVERKGVYLLTRKGKFMADRIALDLFFV